MLHKFNAIGSIVSSSTCDKLDRSFFGGDGGQTMMASKTMMKTEYVNDHFLILTVGQMRRKLVGIKKEQNLFFVLCIKWQ